MNKHYSSLSRRIVIQFCLFTLALSIIYGLIAFILMYTLEDSFMERDIVREANYLTQEYEQTGQWPAPRNNYMKLYFSKETLPDEVRALALSEPKRREFYGNQGRHYHLHTIEQPRAYVLAEVSQQLLVRPIRGGVIEFLIISGLFVASIACFIAWLVARKTTRPLKQLAQLVGDVEPENLPKTFAENYPNNEIGVLAQALETAMSRISEAMRREKNFTRDVSHELRTPLAIVKNASEVFETLPNPTAQESALIKRIASAGLEMEKTVETLLVLARAEHTDEVPHTYALMPLVESAVINNSYLISTKSIEVDIDDSCQQTLTGQVGMIKVLLNNLISNAFQYTEQGDVRVYFDSGQLIVEDTGPGIDSEIVDKVTEPSVKGQQSTGFGFGLSIVKRLCQHQGWQLTVSSNLASSNLVSSKKGTKISVKIS